MALLSVHSGSDVLYVHNDAQHCTIFDLLEEKNRIRSELVLASTCAFSPRLIAAHTITDLALGAKVCVVLRVVEPYVVELGYINTRQQKYVEMVRFPCKLESLSSLWSSAQPANNHTSSMHISILSGPVCILADASGMYVLSHDGEQYGTASAITAVQDRRWDVQHVRFPAHAAICQVLHCDRTASHIRVWMKAAQSWSLEWQYVPSTKHTDDIETVVWRTVLFVPGGRQKPTRLTTTLTPNGIVPAYSGLAVAVLETSRGYIIMATRDCRLLWFSTDGDLCGSVDIDCIGDRLVELPMERDSVCVGVHSAVQNTWMLYEIVNPARNIAMNVHTLGKCNVDNFVIVSVDAKRPWSSRSVVCKRRNQSHLVVLSLPLNTARVQQLCQSDDIKNTITSAQDDAKMEDSTQTEKVDSVNGTSVSSTDKPVSSGKHTEKVLLALDRRYDAGMQQLDELSALIKQQRSLLRHSTDTLSEIVSGSQHTTQRHMEQDAWAEDELVDFQSAVLARQPPVESKHTDTTSEESGAIISPWFGLLSIANKGHSMTGDQAQRRVERSRPDVYSATIAHVTGQDLWHIQVFLGNALATRFHNLVLVASGTQASESWRFVTNTVQVLASGKNIVMGGTVRLRHASTVATAAQSSGPIQIHIRFETDSDVSGVPGVQRAYCIGSSELLHDSHTHAFVPPVLHRSKLTTAVFDTAVGRTGDLLLEGAVSGDWLYQCLSQWLGMSKLQLVKVRSQPTDNVVHATQSGGDNTDVDDDSGIEEIGGISADSGLVVPELVSCYDIVSMTHIPGLDWPARIRYGVVHTTVHGSASVRLTLQNECDWSQTLQRLQQKLEGKNVTIQVNWGMFDFVEPITAFATHLTKELETLQHRLSAIQSISRHLWHEKNEQQQQWEQVYTSFCDLSREWLMLQVQTDHLASHVVCSGIVTDQ
jgi:hypothetical protein